MITQGKSQWRPSSNRRKKNSPPAAAEGTTSMIQDEGELASGSGPSVSPLSTSFPPDRRLPLPLPLRAWLFIEPALAQFRVKPRALNLSLEPYGEPFRGFLPLGRSLPTVSYSLAEPAKFRDR